MMDITKSREEFEKQFPIPKHVIRCGTGYAVTSYGAWEANSYLDLWKGWLAGRESIEVVIPPFDGYKDHVAKELQEALKIALRTAGIRIKGEIE